jgi:hypothetical protein
MIKNTNNSADSNSADTKKKVKDKVEVKRFQHIKIKFNQIKPLNSELSEGGI